MSTDSTQASSAHENAIALLWKRAQREKLGEAVKLTEAEIQQWAKDLGKQDKSAVNDFLDSKTFSQMDAGDGSSRDGIRVGLLSPGSLDKNMEAMAWISKNAGKLNQNADTKITKDEILDFLGTAKPEQAGLMKDFIKAKTFSGTDVVYRMDANSAARGAAAAPASQPASKASAASASNPDKEAIKIAKLDVSDLTNRYTKVGSNGVVSTEYPKNSGSEGFNKAGFVERLHSPVFPANHVAFSYEWKPQSGFDFGQGGKLPGLQIGQGAASGGEHSANGASLRLMWKDGGKMTGYLYDMKGTHSKGLPAGGGYGIDLFKDDGLKVKANDWNDIKVEVKLNSIGPNGRSNKNGELSVTVNDKTLSVSGIEWRKNKDQKITEILGHTFFGGPGNSPKTQSAQFKDFKLAKFA